MAEISEAVGVAGAIDGDASPPTLAAGVEADADGLDEVEGEGGALGAEPPVEQAAIDPVARSTTRIASVRRVSTTIAESSPRRRCLASATRVRGNGHIDLR
jgi:hypothetical protein